MKKSKFLRIFDLYFDITSGKPQLPDRPDVRIEMNSISWSLKISVYINGYVKDGFPDYVYCITDESSNDELDRAIMMLELCKQIVDISKKTFKK